MKDYYTKEKRSAYNKAYRKKHKEHLKWMQQLYRSRRDSSAVPGNRGA